MISSLILAVWVLVTHAPGWSEPVITTDSFLVGSNHYKALEITGLNSIHQIWDHLNQEPRVGYKAYYPGISIIYPETMISNDVWSGIPTTASIGSDSIAAFWRESTPAWYCVRNSDGTEAVPTSLYIPDPYVMRWHVNASSDSLGRIHASFETSAGIVYNVYEPGVGEVWRDTIPSSVEVGMILVDGTRVHIVFMGPDQNPDYIQYDLNGNVTIPIVSLVEDFTDFDEVWTMDVDSSGNLYCFFKVSRSGYYLSLFKIDGETGDILIYDKMIYDPLYGINFPIILATPTGDSFYLLWIDREQDYPRHIKFAYIDTDGDFIETPYSAYDYTDEEIQNLQILAATTNDQGDIFAIWDQGDMEVGGYWIVLGWFDHNWVGIEDETESVDSPVITMSLSSNPFTDFLSIEVTGSPQVQELVIYDITGRQVRTLGSSNEMTFLWDGSDCEGNQLPSGAYIIRADTPEARATIKVVKLD